MSPHDFIDPKVDFAFKKVFGYAEHPGTLLNLLNSLFLSIGEREIKEVTVLNPLLDAEQIDDKTCLLDIFAKTDQGELLNIEMQIIDRKDWLERSLYYWSGMFQRQLKKGNDYHQLKRTLCISFLNFRLFDRSRGLSIYELREREDQALLTPLMGLLFIELPKVRDNQPPDWDPDFKTWLTFMNARSSEDLQNLNIKNPYIREARELLELISQKPEDRSKYATRIEEVRDYYSGLSAERHYALQKGIQLGIEKGIVQGLEQGLAQGLEQGEKKHQQALQQIACDLLTQGWSPESIAATTHLAIDEIKKLMH